jgi:hypothetical protein
MLARMRTTKIGALALVVISAGFAVATSAFQLPRWMGWVAIVVMSLAGATLLAELGLKRLPWEIRRKNPELDAAVERQMMLALLRYDLLKALDVILVMKDPKPSDLRAWADNLAERLRNDGFAVSAKLVEVHLLDNADQAAIDKRYGEVRDALMRMLIRDEFR